VRRANSRDRTRFKKGACLKTGGNSDAGRVHRTPSLPPPLSSTKGGCGRNVVPAKGRQRSRSRSAGHDRNRSVALDAAEIEHSWREGVLPREELNVEIGTSTTELSIISHCHRDGAQSPKEEGVLRGGTRSMSSTLWCGT